MSNALAIAAVTETLVQLVQDHLGVSGVAGAQVTALQPDGAAPLPNPGVNVFLYQVTPNKAYRNADLPTRDAQGNLLRKPQVALDLHYLLTFYGDDTALEQQRMLAAAALALHARPSLPRTLVAQVQAATPFLTTSNLDKQAELIRVTPAILTLEELSKLWSFLLKVDYVLSAAYVASVVLIETDDRVPGPALPVESFTVTALPFSQPVIDRVVASPDPAAPIVDGATVALVGSHLAAAAGGATEVVIDGQTLAPLTAAADSVTVTLPAGAFDAGPLTAQIVQPLSLGKPPAPHPGAGVTSGIAAFVLRPTIVGGNVQKVAGPALRFDVAPKAKAGQRVVLQLTAQAGGAARLADGGVLTADSATLTVPIPGVAAGSYFVQVLVDGAQSPLTPAAGPPAGPLVAV